MYATLRVLNQIIVAKESMKILIQTLHDVIIMLTLKIPDNVHFNFIDKKELFCCDYLLGYNSLNTKMME